jgi:protein-disulfide isomerase
MARKNPTAKDASRRRQREAARASKAGSAGTSAGTSGSGSSARSTGKGPVVQKRALWASPTALVTVAAIVATVILIYSLNNRPKPSDVALITPANPVPASIARQGTTLGTSSAPVKMDTWEDFQCPYCQIWTLQWEPNLIRDFVAPGTLTYTFNNYAFLGDGHDPDESVDAAVAASCANDQGKFWEYHDWLYTNQNPNGENQGWFVTSTFDAIAHKVGLDQAKFDSCLADPARAATIKAERAKGVSLGVNETPTIMVNGKAVTLTTYTDLANLIRSLSGTASPGPSSSGSPGVTPTSSATPTSSP